MVYKEIRFVFPKIRSSHTKEIFQCLHKNIEIVRHPNVLCDNIVSAIMWGRHEKLVVIDQSVAYFGGIDLCYGRWDDSSHR